MTAEARQAGQGKHRTHAIATVPTSTAGPFALSFSDAERAGQVLMWSPEGVGDFADIAWVIAGLLGNGAGVRGLEVRVSDSGVLHACVRAASAEYVTAVAAGHGWRLYVPDDVYANAWGSVGEITVDVTWISPARVSTKAAATEPAEPSVPSTVGSEIVASSVVAS